MMAKRMKKTMAMLLALVLALSLLPMTALAGGHKDDGTPRTYNFEIEVERDVDDDGIPLPHETVTVEIFSKKDAKGDLLYSGPHETNGDSKIFLENINMTSVPKSVKVTYVNSGVTYTDIENFDDDDYEENTNTWKEDLELKTDGHSGGTGEKKTVTHLDLGQKVSGTGAQITMPQSVTIHLADGTDKTVDYSGKTSTGSDKTTQWRYNFSEGHNNNYYISNNESDGSSKRVVGFSVTYKVGEVTYNYETYDYSVLLAGVRNCPGKSGLDVNISGTEEASSYYYKVVSRLYEGDLNGAPVHTSGDSTVASVTSASVDITDQVQGQYVHETKTYSLQTVSVQLFGGTAAVTTNYTVDLSSSKNDRDKPVTVYLDYLYVPVTETVGAGYFVLMPGLIVPENGTDTSKYYPYDLDSGVDYTTGYIGAITTQAVAAVTATPPGEGGASRLKITAGDYGGYLIAPTSYGTKLLEAVRAHYGNQNLTLNDITIVWYEINNSAVSKDWPTPNRTDPSKSGYHVDGYVDDVAINVIYHPNHSSLTTYKDHRQNANGGELKSGDAYQVLTYGETQLAGYNGYEFKGWATSESGPVAYEAGAEIPVLIRSMELWAVWEQIPVGSLTISKSFSGTPENGVPTGFAATFTLTDTADASKTYTASYSNGGVSFTGIPYGTYTLTEEVTGGGSFAGTVSGKRGTYSYGSFTLSGDAVSEEKIVIDAASETAAVVNNYTFAASDEVAINYTWMSGYGWPANAPAGAVNPLATPITDNVKANVLSSYTLRAMVGLGGLDAAYYSIDVDWYMDNGSGGYTKTDVLDAVKALEGGQSITLYAKLNYADTYSYSVVYQLYDRTDGVLNETAVHEHTLDTQTIDRKGATAASVKSAAYTAAPKALPEAMKPQGNTKTYNVGGSTDTRLTVTGNLATGTLTVYVPYYSDTATKTDVTVTKSFSGITPDAGLTASFQIAYTDGQGAFSGILTIDGHQVNGAATTAANSGSTYTWTIEDVPFDTELTFTESGYGVTGYDVTTTPAAVSGVVSQTLTVSASDKAVAFRNAYTSKTYTVNFVLEGGNGTLTGAGKNHVWGELSANGTHQGYAWIESGASANADTASYTFTYGEWLSNKEAMEFTAGNSTGANVKVTAGAGYTWTSGSFNLKDSDKTAYANLEAAMAAMIAANETEITYYTSVTRDLGNLTVTKKVTGLTGDAAAAAHAYTFTITGPDGKVVNASRDDGNYVIEVTGNGSERITLKDLPTGDYTVVENYVAIDGHKLTGYLKDGVKTTVEKGKTAAAAVTNAYVKADGAGSFTLTFDKTVQGDEFAMAGGEFTFRVLNSKGEALEGATGTNAADGSVTIAVPFTDQLPDVQGTDSYAKTNHLFYVDEAAGSVPGMSYDGTRYGLNVAIQWTFKDNAWTYEVSGVSLWNGKDTEAGKYEVTNEGVAAARDAEKATQVNLTKTDGAVFTNEYRMVFLTVRKGYVNISDLPDDYAIDISSGGEVVMTLTTKDEDVFHSTGESYYAWRILLPALADGGRYTFTERNLGGAPTLTAQFGLWDRERQANVYTGLTVNGYSFDVALGVELLYEETTEVRMTNTYSGTTIIIPEDTPPVTPPTTPTPPPEEQTPPPTEEIEDEDVPMADLPDEPAKPEDPVEIEDIEDEEVPMAEPEKTGDNLGLWLAGTAASGLGLVWMILTGRKRRDEDA